MTLTDKLSSRQDPIAMSVMGSAVLTANPEAERKQHIHLSCNVRDITYDIYCSTATLVNAFCKNSHQQGATITDLRGGVLPLQH